MHSKNPNFQPHSFPSPLTRLPPQEVGLIRGFLPPLPPPLLRLKNETHHRPFLSESPDLKPKPISPSSQKRIFPLHRPFLSQLPTRIARYEPHATTIDLTRI